MDVLDIDGKPTNGSNNINCLVFNSSQAEPVNITIPYNNIIIMCFLRVFDQISVAYQLSL